MNNKHLARMLILTSSFPRDPQDETCGYIREFARALAREFDVTVLAPREDHVAGWPDDRFRLVRASSASPVKCEPFRGTADLNLVTQAKFRVRAAAVLSFIAYARGAARLARDADVICAHWLAPCGIIAVIIGLLMRRPVVVVEHSGALHFLMGSFFGRSVLKWTVKRCARVVTVSEDLRRKLLAVVDPGEKQTRPKVDGLREEHRVQGLIQRRVAETTRSSLRSLCALGASAVSPAFDRRSPFNASSRVVVLPMGVHIPGATVSLSRAAVQHAVGSSKTANLRTLLYIGRLVPIKGVSVLLHAVTELPKTRLIIAGEGPLREELEGEAQLLGIEAVFTGRVDAEQRARLLASCDAVVIPSLILASGRSEGLPVVCLEAMAAGKPVIASRTGGLAEVVVDGQNGLLAKPGDHVDLAARIRTVLEDAALRTRLGAKAAETASRFDWSILGQQFASLINEVLAENRQLRGLNNAGNHDSRAGRRSLRQGAAV
ncbi:MAG TPA: glycosyltransferase [Blastocatellia bacterium]|nr:glycosyltransferase [Blastocatellia bacterium]